MPKIRITAMGIYDGQGREIPIGTTFTVINEPTAWAGRYEVVGDKEEDTVQPNRTDANEAAAELLKGANEEPQRKLTAAEKKAAKAEAEKVETASVTTVLSVATPAAEPAPAAPAATTDVPAPPAATGTAPWQA